MLLPIIQNWIFNSKVEGYVVILGGEKFPTDKIPWRLDRDLSEGSAFSVSRSFCLFTFDFRFMTSHRDLLWDFHHLSFAFECPVNVAL